MKEVVTLGTSEIEKMSQNAGENKSFITGVGKTQWETDLSSGSQFHYTGGKRIKEMDPWEI